MKRIYLDHNATCPPSDKAIDAVGWAMENLRGNPSAAHSEGMGARKLIEGARKKVAHMVGAFPREIHFFSGGTEANCSILTSTALASLGNLSGKRQKSPSIVISSIEHPSIVETCESLARIGIETIKVPCSPDGTILPDAFAAAIGPSTILACLMLANNETGVVQPVAEVSRICSDANVLLHVDAVQGPGRIPVDFKALGASTGVISAHKFGGPMGVGALYVRTGVKIEPLMRGGSQERGVRPGTENLPGIWGMAAACENAVEALSGAGFVKVHRDKMEELLLEGVNGLRINGRTAERMPNTCSATIPGIPGSDIVAALDRDGFSISAGSACKAGSGRASHVLEAMGLGEEAACSVRISLGPATTLDEVEAFARVFGRTVSRLTRARERAKS